jgi:regulatory protein
MKIIKYKKIKNKYRVFFDNDLKIDLNDNIILKYELLLKKEIDQKLFDEIVLANNKENIYEHALKYINIKIRSKEEIYNYLNKKGYEKEDINNTITRLEKNNLINDDLYVKSYIHDKFYLSSDGLNKIKKYLLDLKLDESIINKYIDEIDREDILDKLNKLIDKKIKSSKTYSGNILRLKLINYFFELGYNKSDIEEILNNKDLMDIDFGIKEYNKLYNKYSKKYDGYELENYIRNKLYQKGYDLNEIKKNID